MNQNRYCLKFVPLLLLALLVVSANLWAASIDFYRAQVPVKSQSSGERSRAAAIGLKEVLVRMSGMSHIASAEGVLGELNRASRYIELFDYTTITDEQGEEVAAINLMFSEPLVVRLLEQNGLPFWPTNRPKVLLWLVEDNPEHGKQLLNDPNHLAVEAVRQAANIRGLPTMLPLLDLDDQLSIDAEQVWGLQEDAIVNASKRYGADTLLVGRIAQSSSGLWLTSWEFFQGSNTRLYDARGESIHQVAIEGVNPLADYLASLYAVMPNDASPLVVATMNDIDTYSAYRRMVSYLEKQAIVTRFRVERVAGEQVHLTLQLSGTLQQFQNALSLDNTIETEILSEYADTPWRMAMLGTSSTPLNLFWRGPR